MLKGHTSVSAPLSALPKTTRQLRKVAVCLNVTSVTLHVGIELVTFTVTHSAGFSSRGLISSLELKHLVVHVHKHTHTPCTVCHGPGCGHLIRRLQYFFTQSLDRSPFFTHTHTDISGCKCIRIRRTGVEWSQCSILQANDVTPIKWGFIGRISRLKYEGGYELWPPWVLSVHEKHTRTHTQSGKHEYLIYLYSQSHLS